MSRPPPRGLTAEERALWNRLTATVTPLNPLPKREGDQAKNGGGAPSAVSSPKVMPPPKRVKGRVPPPLPPKPLPQSSAPTPGLDSHWERRLSRSSTAPDFTLDLHGHTLEQAYHRLDAGLVQAKALGARLVLVITGKPRPVHAADRGDRRGAIRAKILDWLAAGPHAADIAAVRNAHRRHGGEGALYLVLRRQH